MTLYEEKYNIICLSNQLWDFPNWTNKRHVMYRMAERGNNVLFVDPPLNTGRVFSKQVKKGNWGPLRLLTQKKKDKSGVIVYTPLNTIPFSETTAGWHIKRINKLAKKHLDPNLKTILWVYHVQLQHLKDYTDSIEHDFLVYDCVDNYEGFPENSSFYSTTVPKKQVIEQERELTEKADVVFATAPGLVDKLKIFSKSVHFTPNVGDYERFKVVPLIPSDKIPEEIRNIPRPRVGYIGALDDYKFDYELVKKVARDHPGYSFILIGPLALKDQEASLEDLGFGGLENVYFLGSRPYDQKEYYLAGFDVDMIPYQLNDYTVGGCFPVKFHDSLAAELPVVVTDMPAYIPFRDVCYISKNFEEFSQNIKRALEEDTAEKRKQRQLVAKDNNWEGKVDKMLGILSETIKKKAAQE